MKTSCPDYEIEYQSEIKGFAFFKMSSSNTMLIRDRQIKPRLYDSPFDSEINYIEERVCRKKGRCILYVSD